MEDGFKSMQEEAVRRALEMQRRVRGDAVPQQQEQPKEQSQPPVIPDPIKDLIGLDLDEEKALIGLLIYILYKNGADIKLLLGLGYLLF